MNPYGKAALIAGCLTVALSHVGSLRAASTSKPAAPLTAEQLAEGWIALFDGETLFGWEPVHKADWRVENGEIHATAGEESWLMTTAEFADFELYLEYKAPADTNSGVFFRTAVPPTNPRSDCYEVNIAPQPHPFPTGSLVERQQADIVVADREAWHSISITARGPAVAIAHDGEVTVEHTDNSGPHRGRIGLQFREGPIAFRNVRLRPLKTQPLFNGRDLTGWNTDRADESRFEVTPGGELRVLDGRGQLESEGSYGDFALQLECFVDGDVLNSGVFYRCIPRDFMMGYESQIHNGVVDGDPAHPVDCGTGGIFLRQDARRVVARDREWFTKTIVATGPHTAVWVNGYQVSDWTDTRPPDENPRRGLRTEPGTIAIQGHDPTTDIRFRKLRIAEYPSLAEGD
ncbi:MAG: DUF1080 domain-containing protein [Planctomycetota bacterium]